MNTFFTNLKREAEANPMIALVVGTALLTAAGKFVDASGATIGRAAYAKQVENSIRKNQK